MDEAIINDGFNFPDLNAKVDPERIREDSITIGPAQQILLVGEEVG